MTVLALAYHAKPETVRAVTRVRNSNPVAKTSGHGVLEGIPWLVGLLLYRGSMA